MENFEVYDVCGNCEHMRFVETFGCVDMPVCAYDVDEMREVSEKSSCENFAAVEIPASCGARVVRGDE